MTTEEQLHAEVQRLRGELAEEREERKRLARLLELSMTRRGGSAERMARKRARDVTVTPDVTSHVTLAPPPPLLEGSPPSPVPLSPSPISSPPSLFPPPPSAVPHEELQLDPQKPPRRVKKPKPDKPTDPRHAPLVKSLVKEVGFPFDGPKDAAHVKGLLALADQVPSTAGDLAPAEVLRRARIAWGQFPGFNSARTLGDFRSHWGRFAEPTTRSAGPPDGLTAAPPDACAGCGSRGQGGSVGEPEVWLVYECGCLPAFTEAQSKGLHFTKAAEWAAQRRAA